MAQLDHAALCRVREVSIQGQTPFLVMDWAEGAPLDEVWAKWTVTRRLALLLRVVDGIAVAHQQGVLHGDIKPANILVRRDGKPTIVDFGLARSERDPAPAVGEAEGDNGRGRIHGGTPGFSAVEQFVPGGELSPATDVYALGVLLYMLLTDRTPYPTEVAPAVLVERMTRFDPPLPESLRGEAVPELQKICLKALERRAGDRYRDAGEMAAELRRYLRREPVRARPTVLLRRFEEQVQEQSDVTREWLRLGLISADHAGVVLDGLRRAKEAEYWPVDADRLSIARGGQRIGGLLASATLVASLGVSGMGWTSFAAACVSFVVFTGVGVRLCRGQRERDAAAALTTALVAVPVAVIGLLRELGVLGGAGGGVIRGMVESLPGGFPPAPLVPTDAQVVAAALATLVAAIGFRAVASLGAFTMVALVSLVVGWLGLSSMLGFGSAERLGHIGGWFAVLGGVVLVVALSLDWWEQTRERRLRQPPRDAGATLWTASVLVIGGVSLAAWFLAGEVSRGEGAGSLDAASARGFGLLIAAGATAGLAAFLRLRVTPLRGSVAGVLRVLMPLQALAGLVLLHVGNPGGFGPVALGLIVVAGLVLAYVGTEIKSRLFMLYGQVFLSLAIVLVARAVEPGVSGDPSLAGAILTALFVAGAAMLTMSWVVPAVLARQRLRRWNRRAASDRTRTGMSSRGTPVR